MQGGHRGRREGLSLGHTGYSGASRIRAGVALRWLHGSEIAEPLVLGS